MCYVILCNFTSTVKLKNYKVTIDGRTFFDKLIKNYLKTYDKIRNIVTGQGDDYTSACVLDYNYFKKCYKMITIDLSKQQALDADPKVMQQISFTRNLARE